MLFLTPSLLLAGETLGLHLPAIGWQSLVNAGNLSADHALETHPVTNLANPATWSLWQSGSTADQYVTVDLDVSDPVDYLAVARHNLGSAGIVVSVEGLTAEPGADWEELFPETLVGTDRPHLFRFEPAYLIGIRLRLQPVDTAPQAAILHVGKLLILEWGVQTGHTPLPFARERDIVVGRSQSGEYLDRIQTGGVLRAPAEIRNLSETFYREHVDPFFAANPPFFFAWAPLDHPDEVGFAWLTNDPKPVLTDARYIDVSFQMEGLAL